MEGRHFTMHDEDGGRRTWPGATDPLAPGGKIGARLRAFYTALEQDPVPDTLLDLLEKLDEAERRHKHE
jgi:hypothetical protein